MNVKKILLSNFRNYSSLSLSLGKNINIIVGDNGIGKSNILESLVLISNSKSFRVNDDFLMVKHNEDYGKVEIFDEKNIYKIVINDENKNCFINDNKISVKDFIGTLNCILFEPSDITMFKDSPKRRRKILDMELSKIDKKYLNHSFVYFKLLKEKNSLLKNKEVDKLMLEMINDSLLEPLIYIVKKRKEFIDFINENINHYYKLLTNTNKNIHVKYEMCVENLEKESVKNKFKDNINKDLIYKSSYLGIHKEDIKFYMNDNEINTIASQGQRRMVVVAFKICLTKYIEKISGKKPILLLDDILSELDKSNQQRLIEILDKDTQIIISATDIEKIKINRNYRLIEIK